MVSFSRYRPVSTIWRRPLTHEERLRVSIEPCARRKYTNGLEFRDTPRDSKNEYGVWKNPLNDRRRRNENRGAERTMIPSSSSLLLSLSRAWNALEEDPSSAGRHGALPSDARRYDLGRFVVSSSFGEKNPID